MFLNKLNVSIKPKSSSVLFPKWLIVWKLVRVYRIFYSLESFSSANNIVSGKFVYLQWKCPTRRGFLSTHCRELFFKDFFRLTSTVNIFTLHPSISSYIHPEESYDEGSDSRQTREGRQYSWRLSEAIITLSPSSSQWGREDHNQGLQNSRIWRDHLLSLTSRQFIEVLMWKIYAMPNQNSSS